MSGVPQSKQSPDDLADSVRAFLSEEIQRNGGPAPARNPGHRVPFHWPPHPPSYSYHLVASDWRGKSSLDIDGETFPVTVARTRFGVFGKCEPLWLEAMGPSESEMLANLATATEPLFARQWAIARSIRSDRRFSGHVRDLDDATLLRLLYCEDRDVAHEARTELELRETQALYIPAFIVILGDDAHPQRRSAQWCVLDLLEDVLAFTPADGSQRSAVEAIRDLIWNAADDHARTIYKAGVVLGGHLPGEVGGPVLLECLGAPSRFGRRAAIHGLFHVVEWQPEMRPAVLEAIQDLVQSDPDPVLREYAARMSRDIELGGIDHVSDPVFPEEPH